MQPPDWKLKASGFLRKTCGFSRTSQPQQIADGCFDFSHLGGAELAHAPGEFAVIETGESLHVHSGVFGQPAGFAEIDLASHASDLRGQRGDNGESAGIVASGECQNQNRAALFIMPSSANQIKSPKGYC